MGKKLVKSLDKALMALGRPDAKLMFQHGNGDAGYFVILIPHGSFCISNSDAKKLLARDDVQPHDSGLLTGHPQSWTLVRRSAP